MDGGREEGAAPAPAVQEVELLVAVVAEEDGERGGLGGEEEDDGELGDGEEAGAVGVVDQLGVEGYAEEEEGVVGDD